MNQIPDITIPSSLDLVAQHRTTCVNGVTLDTLRAPGSGVVRLTLVFKGGSSVQKAPFAAASALSMITEGSEDYTAAQIAEQLDYYGIFFDNVTDRDYSYLTIASLTKFLPQALDILQSVILRPTFSDEEFDIYRGKKRQQIIVDRQKPSYIAREKFAAAIFGADHPYGRTYPVEDFDRLTTADLRTYHKENLRADRMFAVASGDLTDELIAEIRTMIEQIPTGAVDISAYFPTPTSSDELRTDIARENSTQSCIRMGKLLFTKQHPDYIAMQLLLTVLGGYFGSRLVQNLRQKNGYTYGAYSGLVAMSRSGYLAIATDVALEHRDAAIGEIISEINTLRTELIDHEELTMAKSSITGELMRLVDGPFGIADIAIENIQSDLSPGYLNDFFRAILDTTAEDLRAIAARHLDPATLRTVTVG